MRRRFTQIIGSLGGVARVRYPVAVVPPARAYWLPIAVNMNPTVLVPAGTATLTWDLRR